ncbi:MAG TPA: Fic family protein [Mycobacteriales bacterium]
MYSPLIGSPRNRPEDATFVPPVVEEMWRALDDWERYVHDRSPQLPLLVRTALLHYQFETIHPFLDGNGRIGRLIVVLHLIEQGALPEPLLPVSTYLEQRRSEYYQRLQAVREDGDVDGWLRYFLDAIATVAREAVSRAEALTDLRERYRIALRGRRSRASEVVDLVFTNPVLSSRLVVDRLGVTTQGAHALLRQVEEIKAVRVESRGRGAESRWYADDVLGILEP